MYIYLVDNVVREFIPEENPVFPGVPIEERYPAEFIASLVKIESAEGIESGYVYDPETQTFSAPVYEEVEPLEISEEDTLPEEVKLSLEQRVTALENALAAITAELHKEASV